MPEAGLLFCMMRKMNHVTILMAASVLAMIGLIIFQYKWISHSRELYDEVFHQSACMALCSTLEEYGEGAICSEVNCATACETSAPPDNPFLLGNDFNGLANNNSFHSDLRKSLDFYNIDLNYSLTQVQGQTCMSRQEAGATCVVNIPSEVEGGESYMTLDFPDKQAYMLDKMKFMIGASIIILLFTGCVLLLANWWLLKQKRLLRTNVEIYNNMAHEFRTPLTNIQLASNLLAKDADQLKNKKFLEIISRENSKLIGQVERVLHLARLDNGDYDLHNEQLHLKCLIENVIEEMSIQLEERKAKLHLDVPAGLEILGDRQHLTNVFRNLIDNALKYASQYPEISITAKEQDNRIAISVEDNGVGIPSSQTEFVFEKFQRIQHGNLHEQKGFGLGLAYVKKIVELHKGTVNVESEVNKGSCFNVYLPKLC